ncbi:MAG: glycoside hydrolase family 88 protein [Lachnospiraceae bacterium]
MNKKEVLALADKVLGVLIDSNSEDVFVWGSETDSLDQSSKKNNDHLTMDLWEWPQGVALYGIYKFYMETKEEKYSSYLTSWYDEKLKNGLPGKNVNTMAPMLTLIHLYEITQKAEYLCVCKEWAEWVLEEMPRTEERGLQHITTHDINEGQIWDDTLFMTVLFLGKMASVTGEDKYKQEAMTQFLLHIKYLADQKTGLWYHGFCFEGRHHFGEVFWARGNSWFTACAVEIVELLELEESVATFILDAYRAQVRALMDVQAQGGLWHTILDEDTSYVEASASAAIAYGLLKGKRLHYISKAYDAGIEKALEALLACVDEEGIVDQVSYGTAMGWDREHYRNIPLCPTAYGQALMLLLLAEQYKHLQ